MATGDLDGWVVNGSDWSYKSIKVPSELFNPNSAPNLYTWESNGEWSCYRIEDVFDDVKCSRPILNGQYFPGKSVRWVGYLSDGNEHTWDLGFSLDPLQGQADISPVGDCGDDISKPDNGGGSGGSANADCMALYLYSAGALSNYAVGMATSAALAAYALF